MSDDTWRTIETEDRDVEGYLVVPADGSYTKYAAKGPYDLFETAEAANTAIVGLLKRGVVGVGEVKVMKARLSHHRKVEVYEKPVLRVVSDDEASLA